MLSRLHNALVNMLEDAKKDDIISSSLDPNILTVVDCEFRVFYFSTKQGKVGRTEVQKYC